VKLISRDDVYKICLKFNVYCREWPQDTFSTTHVYSPRSKKFLIYEVNIPKLDIIEKMCSERGLKTRDQCVRFVEKNIAHEVKHVEKQNELLSNCHEVLYFYKTIPKTMAFVENACEDVTIEKEIMATYGDIYVKQCEIYITKDIDTVKRDVEIFINFKKDFQQLLQAIVGFVACNVEDKLLKAIDKARIDSKVKEIVKSMVDTLTRLRRGEISLCECVLGMLQSTLKFRCETKS